jgi:acetylglutamate kinase
VTVVVKISGKPVAEPERASGLWRDLAGGAQRLVLVHGGGRQVDTLLERLGEPVSRRDGIRLTPPSQMPLIAGVLAGEVNQTLVGLLRSAGARPVGLSLASFGVAQCEVDPAYGGRVGRVLPGGCETLAALLHAGCVPVVSSIGCDRAGGLLNINADDAAAGIALGLRAARLVLLTDVPGVLDPSGRTIASVSSESIEGLIAAGVVTGGMAAKVRAACALADRAGCEVVIASWSDAAAAISALPPNASPNAPSPPSQSPWTRITPIQPGLNAGAR